MKSINIKISITKVIAILTFAVIFQSCSSVNENYTKQESSEKLSKQIQSAENENTAKEISTINSNLTQEEFEQAAALLLLAAIANETDNSNTDDNYDNNNYNSNSQLDIHDVVSTELATNIEY